MFSKKCEHCSKTFSAGSPSRLRRRKFCSPDCAFTFNASKRVDRVEKKCLVCSASFSIKKSHANLRETCSKKCWAIEHTKKIAGPNHPNWRGGKPKYKKGDGSPYKTIQVDGCSIYEHRFVMEQHIGRKLRRNEVVHHKNENKKDNRLANLELMTRAEHTRLHDHFGYTEK